jgi:hypothetical protein
LASTHRKDTICEENYLEGSLKRLLSNFGGLRSTWEHGLKKKKKEEKKTRYLTSVLSTDILITKCFSWALVHNCLKKHLKVGHKNVIRSHSDVDKHTNLFHKARDAFSSMPIYNCNGPGNARK